MRLSGLPWFEGSPMVVVTHIPLRCAELQSNLLIVSDPQSRSLCKTFGTTEGLNEGFGTFGKEIFKVVKIWFLHSLGVCMPTRCRDRVFKRPLVSMLQQCAMPCNIEV